MNNTNSTSVEPEEKAHFALQIVYIVTISVMTLLFGLFPLFCKVCKNSSKFLGVANSFSGGIFLGIAFFHLFPESTEIFEDYWKNHEDSHFKHYPNTFFLAFLSYSLILFIEKIAFDSHSLVEHDHGDGDHAHNHKDHKHHHEESFDQTTEVKKDSKDNNLNIPLDDNKTNVKKQEDEDEEEESAIKYAISTRGRFASFMQVRQIQKASFIGNPNRQLMRASQIIDPSLPSKVEKMINKSVNTEMKNVGNQPQVSTEQANSNVQPIHSHSESKEVSNLTPYILLIALSFHGFFEGIALGLQETNKEALFLYIAIISHKWAESFTLGISFSKANIEKSTFIKLIILFAVFTPLGAILGLILSNTSKIIEGIFLAMSGGTFVYVSASEVIVEEFSITKHKYLKFFSFLLGGIMIAILAMIE